MTWIIILIIVVVITIIVLVISKNKGISTADYPYIKQDVLFTPAERSFLGVLDQAVGKNVKIFGKVRVADAITPKKGMSRGGWQKAFNKISGKHFDYLLCNKNDLSILCAVELNDSSHNSKKRKDRDIFLEGACKAANIPLVQITAKSTYNISDIQKTIYPHIPGTEAEITLLKEEVVKSVNVDDKICPKCSSLLIKRTAKKGKNIGKEFWACSEFPKCRHIENIIEASGLDLDVSYPV